MPAPSPCYTRSARAAGVAPLIENACAHATSEVSLSARREGHQVALSVTDDGVGIDAALRERLFEPGASAGAGTGLGLGIARRTARSLGGDVVVEPAERISVHRCAPRWPDGTVTRSSSVASLRRDSRCGVNRSEAGLTPSARSRRETSSCARRGVGEQGVRDGSRGTGQAVAAGKGVDVDHHGAVDAFDDVDTIDLQLQRSTRRRPRSLVAGADGSNTAPGRRRAGLQGLRSPPTSVPMPYILAVDAGAGHPVLHQIRARRCRRLHGRGHPTARPHCLHRRRPAHLHRDGVSRCPGPCLVNVRHRRRTRDREARVRQPLLHGAAVHRQQRRPRRVAAPGGPAPPVRRRS